MAVGPELPHLKQLLPYSCCIQELQVCTWIHILCLPQQHAWDKLAENVVNLCREGEGHSHWDANRGDSVSP